MTENTIGGRKKRPQENKKNIGKLPYNTDYTYFIIKKTPNFTFIEVLHVSTTQSGHNVAHKNMCKEASCGPLFIDTKCIIFIIKYLCWNIFLVKHH